MCIRLHIHRMACDVRPFVAIARNSRQGKLSITYINPYHPPLQCPHNHLLKHQNQTTNKNKTKTSTDNPSPCPSNGCCQRQSLDLPCDCAHYHYPWGKEGPHENLTRCPHFREYNEYAFRRHPDVNTPIDHNHNQEEAEKEEWSQHPALDSWVTMRANPNWRKPDTQPNWFCEGAGWRAVRERVVESGLRLHVVVRRAEACQRGLWVRVGGGTEEEEGKEEEEEELVRVREEMEAVWAEARRCQGVAKKMDGARAEGLLGFGEGEEEWDEERFGMHTWTYPGKESFF